MKYKLISKNNPKLKPIEQVLINRGIPYTELQSYLNTTDDDINSPLLLGEENLMAAATAIITAINNNQKAKIIVDSDCDGYTSSAILLNYLYELFPSWIENNVEWILHNGKEHGLNDMPLAEWLQEEVKLVICPDSSSEDYDEHKFLKDHEITTIVFLGLFISLACFSLVSIICLTTLIVVFKSLLRTDIIEPLNEGIVLI